MKNLRLQYIRWWSQGHTVRSVRAWIWPTIFWPQRIINKHCKAFFLEELWMPHQHTSSCFLQGNICVSGKESWRKRCCFLRELFSQWMVKTNSWELWPSNKLCSEKAMATHSSALAWKIPWMEEPGRLQSMGSLRVRHDRATSLSLFTFMPWRRK